MKNTNFETDFNRNEEQQYIKSYMFIKGYAIAKDLKQTLIALAFARKLHDGQYRKDGYPYIIHPLKVCSTLINYGVDDDVVLAAALLHDVLEDCQDKLPMGGKEFVSEYHLEPEVLEVVKLLTKKHGASQEELAAYFGAIKENQKALLVKLSDRLHNSSTLYTFSIEKIHEYTAETANFIIPMASYAKCYYPEYTNVFSILKSNIYSLNHIMEIMLQKFEEHEAQLQKEIDELKNKEN